MQTQLAVGLCRRECCCELPRKVRKQPAVSPCSALGGCSSGLELAEIGP